jgi:hypothetical protein
MPKRGSNKSVRAEPKLAGRIGPRELQIEIRGRKPKVICFNPSDHRNRLLATVMIDVAFRYATRYPGRYQDVQSVLGHVLDWSDQKPPSLKFQDLNRRHYLSFCHHLRSRGIVAMHIVKLLRLLLLSAEEFGLATFNAKFQKMLRTRPEGRPKKQSGGLPAFSDHQLAAIKRGCKAVAQSAYRRCEDSRRKADCHADDRVKRVLSLAMAGTLKVSDVEDLLGAKSTCASAPAVHCDVVEWQKLKPASRPTARLLAQRVVRWAYHAVHPSSDEAQAFSTIFALACGREYEVVSKLHCSDFEFASDEIRLDYEKGRAHMEGSMSLLTDQPWDAGPILRRWQTLSSPLRALAANIYPGAAQWLWIGLADTVWNSIGVPIPNTGIGPGQKGGQRYVSGLQVKSIGSWSDFGRRHLGLTECVDPRRLRSTYEAFASKASSFPLCGRSGTSMRRPSNGHSSARSTLLYNG